GLDRERRCRRAKPTEQITSPIQIPLGGERVAALEQKRPSIAKQLRFPENVSARTEQRERGVGSPEWLRGRPGVPENRDPEDLRASLFVLVQRRARQVELTYGRIDRTAAGQVQCEPT